MKYQNIVELMRYQAEQRPESPAFTFLADGELEEISITFRELDRCARSLGARLTELNGRGERALLIYPTGLDYITAIFGCLYAGIPFLPAFPPRFKQKKVQDKNMERLQVIIKDADAKFALTTDSIYSRIKELLPQHPDLNNLHWVVTDTISDEKADEWKNPDLAADSLAFLQYTSGSAADPKGVMVTHKNLLEYQEMQKSAMQHSEKTKIVCWVPFFHDAGLVGHILHTPYLGIELLFMTPASFLQKPARWLQAISRHKITMAGGPNFAYELCAQKITPDERAELDLSSWNVAWNGSEPIRHKTMEKFIKTFQDCGFRRESFFSAYGLAESTLLVSGGVFGSSVKYDHVNGHALQINKARPAIDDDINLTVVSCGAIFDGQKLVIVEPNTEEICKDNEIGEIWVRGPNIAIGYWNNPEESARTFNAFIKGNGEGPFLRTGDLGYLKDGELYVTGRAKDVIIFRGANHYPQDIEEVVEKSHEALRMACTAAFSIEVEGEEQLVIIQEIERTYRKKDFTDVFQAIENDIAELFRLKIYAIVLVKMGTIPKTTSGKIQRSVCRTAFLAEKLQVVCESRARKILGTSKSA